MNKIQLDNLIRFSILFRMEGIDNSSPDYIEEKFLLLLGDVNYRETKIPITDNIKKWASKWRFEDIEKIKNILLFLSTINSHGHLDITCIVDAYNIFFDKIISNKVIRLHPNVETKIKSWVESVAISRDYKVNLVTNNS